MIVGCYTMDLYCDVPDARAGTDHPPDEFPHVFTGQTARRCRRAAMARGWKFLRDGVRAVCPKCARADRPAAGKPKS